MGILNLPSRAVVIKKAPPLTMADAAIFHRILGVYSRNNGVIGVMDSIRKAMIRKNNFFRTVGLRRIADSFQNGAQRFLSRGVPHPTPPESSCTLRAMRYPANTSKLGSCSDEFRCAKKSETRKKKCYVFLEAPLRRIYFEFALEAVHSCTNSCGEKCKDYHDEKCSCRKKARHSVRVSLRLEGFFA